MPGNFFFINSEPIEVSYHPHNKRDLRPSVNGSYEHMLLLILGRETMLRGTSYFVVWNSINIVLRSYDVAANYG